eukprot:8913518-Pyramimonas_sp.AAC.2
MPRVLARANSGSGKCKVGDIDTVAAQLFSLLTPAGKARFIASNKECAASFGTMCSGTDACADALRAVMNCGFAVPSHAFSCEEAQGKQQWILTMINPRPKRLFRDVHDFGRSRAEDLITGTCQTVAAVDIVIIGFSCKDLSHYNIHSPENRDFVASGAGRTGGTLKSALDYIMRCRPRFVFLENVVAMKDVNPKTGLSSDDALRLKMKSIGYLLISCVYDSRCHGSVQRRNRWWGVAVRVSERPISDSELESYQPLQDRMMNYLVRMEMEPGDMDRVLMKEDRLGSDQRKPQQKPKIGHKYPTDTQDR